MDDGRWTMDETMMNTSEIARTLSTLFGELVNGAAKDSGYMLNGGDEGLLRSLEKLSAEDASALTATGSSIAAHADHLRYGLSLMNRWSQGENPFGSADWSRELAQDAGSLRANGGSCAPIFEMRPRAGSMPLAGRETSMKSH